MPDDNSAVIASPATARDYATSAAAVRRSDGELLAARALHNPGRARIALVVPSFPKLSESFIVTKFLGLLKRGWDVHVVCQTSNAKDWQHFPELQQSASAAARVHCCWIQRPRWLALACLPAAFLHCAATNFKGTANYVRRASSRSSFLDALRQLYLDAAIVALRPSILHFEFGPLAMNRTDLVSALACRTVASFRGYDLNLSGAEDLDYYHELWKHADCLHLLGQDLWRRAQARGCPTDKPHCLIPPAIDADLFQPSDHKRFSSTGTADRPLRIVSVGRLEWIKGFEYGLQAIRHLLDRGIHCHYEIIGDGEYLEAISFARHQLALTDVVQLTGGLPPDQVRSKLDEADVFVHPAVSEGFCNAVLEAQAMRLPVVCSDAGGLPENVVDGETGFVIPRRDSAALAERLATLAADPELRQRMGDAGRRRVLDNFTLDRQLDAIEAMYRRVLSGAVNSSR